jgi:hypothetical protein
MRGWYPRSALPSNQLGMLTYSDFVSRPCLRRITVAHHHGTGIWTLVVAAFISHVPIISIVSIVLAPVRSV